MVWAALRLGPIAILLVAFALRFINLGQAQLYEDEAASWALASYPVGALLQHNVGKAYPPLYGLLVHGWILLFGDGEAAMRDPSAICGVVTVIVAWRWTKQALGRTAGLIYGVDLLGGFLGGLLGGVLFLPVLGLKETCWMVAMMKISSLLLFFIFTRIGGVQQ